MQCTGKCGHFKYVYVMYFIEVAKRIGQCKYVNDAIQETGTRFKYISTALLLISTLLRL